jgi:hypothetical protein
VAAHRDQVLQGGRQVSMHMWDSPLLLTAVQLGSQDSACQVGTFNSAQLLQAAAVQVHMHQ